MTERREWWLTIRRQMGNHGFDREMVQVWKVEPDEDEQRCWDETLRVVPLKQMLDADRALLVWVVGAHHKDGCARRIGKDCDCGKAAIIRGLVDHTDAPVVETTDAR